MAAARWEPGARSWSSSCRPIPRVHCTWVTGARQPFAGIATLEEYFGHWRYALVYLVSGLAGSAGALLLSPDSLTVGASGAIWGIMGAALLLEARRIYVFGGQALGLVVLNLAITFLIPGISIGGHVGGLIGGAAAALAFSTLRRTPILATLSVAAIGVVAVAVAVSAV